MGSLGQLKEYEGQPEEHDGQLERLEASHSFIFLSCLNAEFQMKCFYFI